MKISKLKFTFDVITLMPEMYLALTDYGVVGRAFKKKNVDLHLSSTSK